MKRLVRTLSLAALAAVLSVPLAAQERGGIGLADRMAHAGGGSLLRCLRDLDLSDSQKSDIKAILDAAKPTFEADASAIQSAHQKLDAAYTAGADKSVIGQDYIDLRAAINKLQTDRQATEDQVLAKLTPDQKTKAEACIDAHKSHRMGMAPFGD